MSPRSKFKVQGSRFKVLLLCGLCAFVAFSARAAQQVTAYLWVTNFANHSNSVTFNSTDIRYAVTNVTNSAVQWPVTNTAAWTATNLLTHLANFPPLGLASYAALKTTTNAAVLQIRAPTSSNLVVVPTGDGGSNWAWVRYETNTVATSTNVVVPRAAITNATAQSNIVSGLVDWLNQPGRSGEKISISAPIFANYADTTSAETLSNKTLVFGVLDGASGQLRNIGLSNVIATNFSAPGPGALSQQIGSNSLASGTRSLAVGVGAQATNVDTVAVGTQASVRATNGIALGSGAYVDVGGDQGISIGVEAGVNARNTVAIGGGTTATHQNAIVIGSGTTSRASNEVALGSSTVGVFVPGNLDVAGTGTVARLTATNFTASAATIATGTISGTLSGTFRGTNSAATNSIVVNSTNVSPTFTAISTNLGAFRHHGLSVTTLAAGNNVIDRTTNNTVYFESTAGAAALCNISTNFGDGDWFEARNDTGFDFTIVHESGFSANAAGRIRFGTGISNATIVIPSGDWMKFIFKSSLNRWTLAYPSVAVVTNAIAPNYGVGTNTTLIRPTISDPIITGTTNFATSGDVTVGNELTVASSATFQSDAHFQSTVVFDDFVYLNSGYITASSRFSGANTTNLVNFSGPATRLTMTNGMTTNTTLLASNIVEGRALELYFIGANGGVIASNYTVTLRTNNLTTATHITWLTTTNGSYDFAVSSNKYGVLKLMPAWFGTNIVAEWREGP